MTATKRTVLITGCSDNSLGAGLAIAFHKAGLYVYAASRNPATMAGLRAQGIETITLDVMSEESIAACASKIPSLDILVNNAGRSYAMPIVDLDLAEAKALFDLNVWSYLAVTKAFLPLLIKSPHGGMVVNQTSTASLIPIPFLVTYSASKAAIAMFTSGLRVELEPFRVKVIELKSSLVKSNAVTGKPKPDANTIPKGSIYEPARKLIDSTLQGNSDQFGQGMETQVYADKVVGDLLQKTPPNVIFRGEGSWMAWFTQILPNSFSESYMAKRFGVDKVGELIRKAKAY